ncbi:MAG: hypothetical protein JWM68_2072 [Verrucomicrobiales bacterium]|nr:hypothetical protein [Verrucomicrobiales bacterium]
MRYMIIAGSTEAPVERDREPDTTIAAFTIGLLLAKLRSQVQVDEEHFPHVAFWKRGNWAFTLKNARNLSQIQLPQWWKDWSDEIKRTDSHIPFSYSSAKRAKTIRYSEKFCPISDLEIHLGVEELKELRLLEIARQIHKDFAQRSGWKKECHLLTSANVIEELRGKLLPTIATATSGGSERQPDDKPVFDIKRFPKYVPEELIGRDKEIERLHEAWEQVKDGVPKRPHILTFVALGGEGKTSLVAKWAAKLAFQGWPSCDGALAWSFYSQGSVDQVGVSSSEFLKKAIELFGSNEDKQLAASSTDLFAVGERLAHILSRRRILLVLDGLEPLQRPPASKTTLPGELKDKGILALLTGLASSNRGLCIVTTRYSIPNLNIFRQTTAQEIRLPGLSREAGVHLLKTFGLIGPAQEFEALVEDVEGHALTLNLLGGFLKRVFHGDIRRRDCVKFERANEGVDGGHAFRAMAAYEKWLLSEGGNDGAREVSILRIMGLFDRPVTMDLLRIFREGFVSDFLAPIFASSNEDWESSLTNLEMAKLVTRQSTTGDDYDLIDAHPLLREYFGHQMRTCHTKTWRPAHLLIYEHLVRAENNPETGMTDIRRCQAIAHACKAGKHSSAFDQVYNIQSWNGVHNTRALGELGSDLEIIACFFEEPWSRVVSSLTEEERSFLFNAAAMALCAQGRLTEAIEPLKIALKNLIEEEICESVAIALGNLTEFHLALGNLSDALVNGKKLLAYLQKCSGHGLHQMFRTSYADALHQAGCRIEAQECFREAEEFQIAQDSNNPPLHSLANFYYSDFLLAAPECSAWKRVLNLEISHNKSESIDVCKDVSQRVAITHKRRIRKKAGDASRQDFEVALYDLTRSRAALYAAILKGESLVRSGIESSSSQSPRHELDLVINTFRRDGAFWFLPRALLTRAWLRFHAGMKIGFDSAQADLDESLEIAKRGPLRPLIADIHLYRARLFFRIKEYPWDKDESGKPHGPKDDLALAEKVICGRSYHRREEELADAKRVICGS